MIEELIEMLKAGRQSKKNLMRVFGATEREIRRMVSEVAREYPVISLSFEGGYKIATKPEDYPLVRKQIKENNNRAKKVIIRNEPLEEFLYKQGGEDE